VLIKGLQDPHDKRQRDKTTQFGFETVAEGDTGRTRCRVSLNLLWQANMNINERRFWRPASPRPWKESRVMDLAWPRVQDKSAWMSPRHGNVSFKFLGPRGTGHACAGLTEPMLVRRRKRAEQQRMAGQSLDWVVAMRCALPFEDNAWTSSTHQLFGHPEQRKPVPKSLERKPVPRVAPRGVLIGA